MAELPLETPAPGPVDAPVARGRRLDARRNLEGIVVAAAELLARSPRASMQEVAVAAGLHRATVHRHFPARDDLLAAVRDHAFAIAAARMAADAEPAEPPIRALERIVQGQIAINDRYRIHRYVPMLESRREADRPDRLSAMTSAVARAQAAGDIRDDLPPSEISIAIVGLIVATLPELAQERMTLEEATAFCLVLVRAHR